MNSDKIFIGIDSGTQGCKTILFDQDSGKILAEAYASHQLISSSQGGMEQDPQWWLDACESSIKAAITKAGIDPKRVKGIGISGQQHGMVALDKSGEVIRPAKLWCDTSTTAQCEEITKRLGGVNQVINKIGNAIAEGYTAAKILWLKQNEPENYQRLDTVLLPHDYINFWLTGEKTTEFGDASGTAYFDVQNRRWSFDVLRAIDPTGKLENCLPRIIQSHEAVGEIRPDIAKTFGFSPNVIVSSGGGDNMMAAIGTGNVSDGTVTASLGTSGTIYACSAHPVIDPQGELAAFCSSSGAWLPLICTMNVTVSTELTRQLLNQSIEDLNQKAASASIGSGGIILLPYFNGERTPALPQSTATLFGLTSTNYTSANLCRSAMEGATFGLRYGLDLLKKQGILPQEIRLVGGGAKSQMWRQIVADILGCPVVQPVVEEAGALGAALQAVWCAEHLQGNPCSLKKITDTYVKLDGSKTVEPVVHHVNQYSDIYAKYLQINTALTPIY